MVIRYNAFGRPCDNLISVKSATPYKRSCNFREDKHAHYVH